MSLPDLPAFVDGLATESGRSILPYFRAPVATEDKSGGAAFDPVTEADRAAELVLRRLIGERYPDHGIIGEEFGNERIEAEHVWVLDPIDGTRAFISGLPLWGTLIGLQRAGRAVYGMMHQPYLGERFFGDGRSAGFRGPHGAGELRTRACRSLAEATLSATSPRMFSDRDLAAFERVEAGAKLTRYGYDCYAYCMLAAGQLDVVIEGGLKPYDIAALVPIIEGAGGVVTDWDGERPEGGGSIVACGDPALHAEVLATLRG